MTANVIKSHTLTAADALDGELAAVRAAAAPTLALDLAAVAFLSSTALSRFVALEQGLKSVGGRLALVNVRPHVRRVYSVARLDGLLDGCAA